MLTGAIASEQSRASAIGGQMLKLGGNAADAMVATIIAVNTLAPFHSDIGGGGFAIVRETSGVYAALDFRHTAPKDVTMQFYKDGASTSVGGSAVAVPGQMRGLAELHSRYGRLSWKSLFEPSIKLARDGAEMRGDLRDFTMRDCNPPGSDIRAGSFYENDRMYDPFFKDGKVLPLGATYYRKEFADTLESIAEQGAEAFYSGELAENMVRVVQERGGLMSLEDLRDYRPKWIEPIRGNYHDYSLYTIPAPASGAIWLSAMGILSHLHTAGKGTGLDYHRVTEALRLSYGQRTELGDPAYVDGLEEKQKGWIEPATTERRAAKISDDKTHDVAYYNPEGIEIVCDAGTSNITTTDSEGLTISVTTTIGLNWGSRIMVPGYGFILNDSMDDFSVEGQPNQTGYAPSRANYVEGGKRPLSSSCPYIIEDSMGKVVLAGGAAGGSTIISANVQVARAVLDFGLSAAEALRYPRLHNQLLPNVSEIEQSSTHQGIKVDGISDEVVKVLESKGHKLREVGVNRSTPCAIKFLPNGIWEAAGEPRKHDSGGCTS